MTIITRSPNLLQCANQTRATVLRYRFNSPALISAANHKLYPWSLSVGFHTLYLALVYFNLWPEINHNVLIPNFRVRCRGSFLLHDVAAARTRTRRRARTTASTEDEWVFRNLRRSRMVKQRETKKHKMKKRSQEGLQLGNWWNLTQKQKRVF